MENLELMVDECYKAYIKDETIVGFDSLLRSKGLGSKRIIKLRNLIYEKYGKEELVKIYRSRLSKRCHTVRPKESYQHTEEWNRNISKGNIESWQKSGKERKELSRKNMLKYCSPNSQTEDAINKRVESRKWYKHSKETIEKIKESNKGRKLTKEHKQKLSISHKGKTTWIKGKTHSDKTRKQLSKSTKTQWQNGVHKRTFKSKGQLEVIEILTKLGYDIENEYLIDGRPYDVLVKNKNLVIEFNGTFWHRDPRFYNHNPSKEKFKIDEKCKKVWQSDLEKLDIAKKKGYNVTIIWQYDWENCPDKVEYLKQIL